MVLSRTDDFRCHDPLLVQVLPGREEEAARCAIHLSESGKCDGVFVQGKDVCDWRFLEVVKGLDRFLFADVNASIRNVDLTVLRNATAFAIADAKVELDLKGFNRLHRFGYQWAKHPVGIEGLDSLKEASFFGMGLAKDAYPLLLPKSLVNLSITRFQRDDVLIEGPRALNQIGIFYARNLRRLPVLESLRKLEIAFVGRDSFDYTSIPESLEELVVDSCAPIDSWGFLHGMTRLRHLFVDKVKCVPLDDRAAELVARLPSCSLPAGAMPNSLAP